MTPRLKSSKKWTAFPTDFVQHIREAFLESFPEDLARGELLIDGRIYAQEILLRVGFLGKNNLRQNNFEVSLDYKQDQAVDRIHDSIDVAASMMADFFAADDGDADFPRTWKAYEFEKQTVYCQYTTENTRLEEEADRLLGLADDGLVKNADDDEEGDRADAPENALASPDLEADDDVTFEAAEEIAEGDEDSDPEFEVANKKSAAGKASKNRKENTSGKAKASATGKPSTRGSSPAKTASKSKRQLH